MIIEYQDIATLDLIRTYTRVGKHEVSIMANFMNKYIEKNVHICGHCEAQIKHAWNRIINWSSNNSEAIEQVRMQNETQIQPEALKQDVATCACGAILPNKRHKYCDSCKAK